MKATSLLFSWLTLLLAGCSLPSNPPSFLEKPTVSANPNPQAPLAAVIYFSTNKPVSTDLHISDNVHEWTLSFNKNHKPEDGLPVVGMRPDREHEIRLTIRDEQGTVAAYSQSLTFTTPPLPVDRTEFPPIRVTLSQSDLMEPGITLFNPRRIRPGDPAFGQSFGMLVAVDAEGDVIWYYRNDSRISDYQQLSNGHIIYVTQDFRVVEIDLLGNIINQWYATGRPLGSTEGIPVETLALHHEIDELPTGNLVVLGVEKRTIENYYTSETDAEAPRESQDVMGDWIIEFKRDGTVSWTWNAFDHLDPFRIGYETFSRYWWSRGFPNTVDWTHANGLMYNEADNSFLVSLRYQAAILKINRSDGEIRWILGEPTGWAENLQNKLLRMEGDSRWFYHQHGPVPSPDGTILVYDNGNYRARPFIPPAPRNEIYSRAVEYAINEETMTAREVWVSEEPGADAVTSAAMGDVDWLPQTGNVLVSYGMLLPRPGRERRPWTRIREYRHTQPAEIVWELVLIDNADEEAIGWAMFGAEHLTSLIPE